MTGDDNTAYICGLSGAQVLPRYVNYTVPIPWEQTHSQDGPAVNHMWHMVGEEARSLTLNTAAAQVTVASTLVARLARRRHQPGCFGGLTPVLVAAQAQAAYETATSAFTFGKQRLVCDGFTRKCQARGEAQRQLGRKAG